MSEFTEEYEGMKIGRYLGSVIMMFVKKAVKKKTGQDLDLQINNIKLKTNNKTGKTNVILDVDCELNDLLKLL